MSNSTSCWPGSGRGRSPRCWALPSSTRPGSPPPPRRSPATPFSTPAAGESSSASRAGPAPAFVIRVRERGPGIRDLQADPGRRVRLADSGLGLGIIGARRLMDRFAIESIPGAGATVSMAKSLPHRTIALTPQELGQNLGRAGETRTAGASGRAPAAEPRAAQHPSGVAR